MKTPVYRQHRRRRPARCGVMLVEILLALAITGMVAAGVASLLFAVSGGTKDRQELRRRNVRVDVLAARIDAAIRSSSMVLGRDSRCLVLWVSDTKPNGAPDLSELRRIEWDSTTKQMRCFEAPATLNPADDTAYALGTTDFVSTTAGLRGLPSFTSTVWANGVSGWSSSPDPVTQSTRVVSYGVTIDLPTGGTHTARSATALRGTTANAG
jgi:type II secretory pathway pseudopilin PulG